MRPVISVIMPAYNCGLYIKRAIDSIIDQTFKDFELLIADDGSQDNTWEIIDSYEDKRIRKFKHERNVGYLQNYNFLLAKVNGEYITCQDADDWSDKSRLECQLSVFSEIRDVHLVGCNGVFYYDSHNIKSCPPFKTGYVSIEQEILPFILPAALYKREVLEVVPGFHTYFDKATSMDQYFLFNILSKFKGYAINEYLYTAQFNFTSNSRTLTNFRKATAHEAYLLLRKQRLATGTDWLLEGKDAEVMAFEKSLVNDRKFMSEKFREYAVYKIDGNNVLDAGYLLARSFIKNPFYGKFYKTLFYWFRKLLRLK
jgi:glycosyltransferase involved in cell wall biosynthesis